MLTRGATNHRLDRRLVLFGSIIAVGLVLDVAIFMLPDEDEAVASARVTAQCFGYGHAIGHAAIISARDGVSPRDIQGADIRMLLNRENAQLD